MNNKLYADRDIMELDELGNYYSDHVSAMTGEGLHSKSDIAAELGYRDLLINELSKELEEHLFLFSQLQKEGVTTYDQEIMSIKQLLSKVKGQVNEGS